MKRKMFLLTLFLLCSLFIRAQYKEEMLKTIAQIEQAENQQTLIAIANKFDRISMINQEEWLPHYYASYVYAKMSYLSEKDDEKDSFLEKSQSEYDKAQKHKNAENDELLILQAYILQAKFSVNYMSRLSLNTEALNILMEVNKKYPSNPRAYLLLGIATYKMPVFIGGSTKKAQVLFEKANEKFVAFKPKNELYPNWGQELNDTWLKRCLEK